MKSELRLHPHSVIHGQQVIEVWHAGKFLATVTAADGPGVRLISKHITGPDSTTVLLHTDPDIKVGAVELRFNL